MKRQSIPIITSSSRGMLLNMATSRKIWCRIDCSTDPVNEPILVEYDEMDTVDDFKTKILNKLNESRWKAENDNASIMLGFYQARNSNTTDTNNDDDVARTSSYAVDATGKTLNKYVGDRNSSRGLQRVESPHNSQLESPVYINSRNDTRSTTNNYSNNANNYNKSSDNLNVTPVLEKPPPLDKLGSSTNDTASGTTYNYDISASTSPQRLSSSSPKLTMSSRIVPPPKYGFHPLSSSFGSGNKNSPMFLPPLTIPYNSPNTTATTNSNNDFNKLGSYGKLNNLIHSPSFPVHASLRKQLNYTVHQVDDNFYRVIFSPDQLISDIYFELFGSLGQQSPSEPLLIFSNKDLSLEKIHLSNESFNRLTSTPGSNLYDKESSTFQLEMKEDQLFQNAPSDEKADKQELEPNEINDNNVSNKSPHYGIENESANRMGNTVDGISSIDRDDGKPTTDSNKDVMEEAITQNGSEGYPRQGVLLLPKGYYNEGTEKDWPSKEDYEDSADVGNGEESILYRDKDSKPLARTTTDSTTSSASSINTNTIKADIPEPPLFHNKRVLSEQDVGPAVVGTEFKKSQLNEPLQTQAMFLNVTNTISNGNPSLGKFGNLSNVPTPLSTTFPVPLKIIKNENIGMNNPDSNNVNTSEKVFPKINVLVVEDNVINQAILGSFLRKHKISYKIAKNGKEAVDIWKEGGLHLIFMDLQLPVLSGIEAAKQIRDFEKKKMKANNAPVIIVALTASNSIDDKRKALISGCNDYLTKPVNLHWLSKKITEWGCMQALIDFDSWKQGQSRMTDNVILKSPHKKAKDN